ncbi:bifunctional phosphoribosyl-AMP cyclohydrolase/phosphoribosyl-ATP diphosphatase HisIE [Sulfoacidibacillus thermotolerans]|uniref:Histidine biosynthesis bifunctional protein HisIE n=1 Tax=Sulfoacidibacillus thermotolerans TaxID=1765684 RepID=A0A2U3D8T1_SULT2|nr:bifunctional phosphoribosyl-AMP cyclohydrolase/phosphoribosyl-ATP diphosphatase HisIE [Sulfoacidibacillus thermotolerans]PWI57679.1 bifunctional phosphoribosyl-AMP cyclohydrolase/phosphoribosyl-ATP pyrophosphatase [Sulfoacidibacillus thermotolerans]
MDFSQFRFDKQGLLPAIVQDVQTGQVLMVAYMNQDALKKSLTTGQMWFYSRSRQALWHKGETSGNTQTIVQAFYDCDADTLLFHVIPAGPACHTGEVSCFVGASDHEVNHTPWLLTSTVEQRPSDVLQLLEQRVAERAAEMPEGSYTTYLFEKGIDKILKKVGEETAEVIIGAKNRNPAEVQYEVADLLYHLMVMLREQNVPFSAILQELERRYAN